MTYNKDGSVRIIKHGLSKHPLYIVYNSMLTRCYNNKNKDYSRYGGRGITVCSEWKNNFICFFNWAIINKWELGLDLDRMDNDGNYCPINCRFITRKLNSFNRGSSNKLVYNGESKPLHDWAESLGITKNAFYGRYRKNNNDLKLTIDGIKKIQLAKILIDALFDAGFSESDINNFINDISQPKLKYG